MDTDNTAPAGHPFVSRDAVAPFLIRAFLKIGGFHKLQSFEDGNLPTADEQQIYAWKDATLGEVLTTLRNVSPNTPEYRHPLARYSFRTVYADSTNKGRFASKDLGMVYSRDILGDPGSLTSTAPRLLEDEETGQTGRKDERTLDELRFVPGDYLLVSVLLPKNVTVTGPSGEIAIKGSATTPSNGWRAGPTSAVGRQGDAGWAGSLGLGAGRGQGHWRGESNAPRGRGGRGMDRDSDRRPPPPRRSLSPPRRGRGGGRRSRSRSRTPPRRKHD